MNDCLFCQIIAGKIPSKEVARAHGALAFHDVNPQAPTHVLVVPEAHVAGPAAASGERGEKTYGAVMRLATEVAAKLGLAESGYRLVLNEGVDGGQSVGHLHVHVLGGRRMKWPPG